MKGEDNFSLLGSSLDDICLYIKQKMFGFAAWKVLSCLCSCSCIVPFNFIILTSIDGMSEIGVKTLVKMLHIEK